MSPPSPGLVGRRGVRPRPREGWSGRRVRTGTLILVAGLCAGPATALAPPAFAVPLRLAVPSTPARAVPVASATTPMLITLGDSDISGEGARWAGNSDLSERAVDALGPAAYFDAPGGTAELVHGCHRSIAAEAGIGAGLRALNLACSGAGTVSRFDPAGDFKPGIDFADDGLGHLGQAAQLQAAATGHDVRAVTITVGGNDFGFAEVVSACITDWLTSPQWWPRRCSEDPAVAGRFSDRFAVVVRSRITAALLNVRTAMRGAGHPDGTWSLIVQTYPSQLPRGARMRYPESGFTRMSVGGCGFWDADLDWADRTALPVINHALRAAAAAAGIARTVVLDVSAALDGRRLCENSVGLLEERGVPAWTAPAAADLTEWVDQIRTVSTIGSPYQEQESLHPNYWGTLALRHCLRLAYNGGAERSGRCVRAGAGLVAAEPDLRLQQPDPEGIRQD
jgi:hypothetical protein